MSSGTGWRRVRSNGKLLLAAQSAGTDSTVRSPVLSWKRSQGVPLEIEFTNRLPEPTVIRWHGLRIPAVTDGTEIVQRPVQPGETFTYRFTPPDAGTFWYHPHLNEAEQLEKGLYGALRASGSPAISHAGLPSPARTCRKLSRPASRCRGAARHVGARARLPVAGFLDRCQFQSAHARSPAQGTLVHGRDSLWISARTPVRTRSSSRVHVAQKAECVQVGQGAVQAIGRKHL